jgi:hypothetical protein
MTVLIQRCHCFPSYFPCASLQTLPREQDVSSRLYNQVSNTRSWTCNITKSDFYRIIFTSPVCIGNITTQRAFDFPHKHMTQTDLRDRMRYLTGNMKYLTKRSLILLDTNQINDCKVKQKIVQTNEWIYSTYIPDFTAPYFETVGYFHNRWRERFGSALSATSQMTATNFIHHVRISVEFSYVQHLNRAGHVKA